MITTVLFDLFGTLVKLECDSKPYHRLVRELPATQRFKLLRKSLVHPYESLAEFSISIGLPVPENIDTLEADLKRDIKSAVLFSDSLPTLVSLKQRGIKIGLISNLATPYKASIKLLGLEEYFDAIILSCDAGVAKPAPSIYQLALEQLGSSSAETVMVGDSYKSDVLGPGNIGITGIHLVRNGPCISYNAIRGLNEIMGRL